MVSQLQDDTALKYHQQINDKSQPLFFSNEPLIYQHIIVTELFHTPAETLLGLVFVEGIYWGNTACEALHPTLD